MGERDKEKGREGEVKHGKALEKAKKQRVGDRAKSVEKQSINQELI